MDCVNHSGVSATAYCQNCGKALCPACVRNASGGQIFCEPCWTAWQSLQQPFVAPHPGGPSPSAAAVLGLIPGVGAMYNGQFFKALVHVVVFVMIIGVTTHYGLFGFFIPAWILYQSFEAYHTAKAMREGQPPPDPLGLNEVGNWLNPGVRPPTAGQPGAGPAGANSAPAGAYQAPYPPPPYQPPYQDPYAPPSAGSTPPGIPPVPPIPPMPPFYWRRREPVGAVILIALGLLFLLGQLNLFSGRLFEFGWPILLIGLGAWLIVRRLPFSQGGSK
jgi:hypothetical protein